MYTVFTIHFFFLHSLTLFCFFFFIERWKLVSEIIFSRVDVYRRVCIRQTYVQFLCIEQNESVLLKYFVLNKTNPLFERVLDVLLRSYFGTFARRSKIIYDHVYGERRIFQHFLADINIAIWVAVDPLRTRVQIVNLFLESTQQRTIRNRFVTSQKWDQRFWRMRTIRI